MISVSFKGFLWPCQTIHLCRSRLWYLPQLLPGIPLLCSGIVGHWGQVSVFLLQCGHELTIIFSLLICLKRCAHLFFFRLNIDGGLLLCSDTFFSTEPLKSRCLLALSVVELFIIGGLITAVFLITSVWLIVTLFFFGNFAGIDWLITVIFLLNIL